ncbi:DUF2288 domain-containing protein [Oxalobacteraceae bacterium R-40]|uniref:DUF2288 domain-containing protein n=1 Tax=Keguizhuia sedimenti TaxID=3064264 RepID=A0ABU1BM57_9BURK|nr:DUF2288 domain-containing protein [Oxalobacteraceae bacterium R-40]
MLDSDKEQKLLHHKLNMETAPMPWKELLKHFAAGIVIVVDNDLDLIQVAASVANDDKAAVKKWMLANQLMKVSDEQAQVWLEQDVLLWTVVVKPFILVQEKKSL